MLFSSSKSIGSDNYTLDNINKLTDYILNNDQLKVLAAKEDWSTLFHDLYFDQDIADFGFLYQYFLDLDAYDVLQNLGHIPMYGFSHTLIHHISIPDNINTIGSSCFSNCILLNSVKLPPVKFISSNTFFKCTSLDSITIPETVKVIGPEVFLRCKKDKCYDYGRENKIIIHCTDSNLEE